MSTVVSSRTFGLPSAPAAEAATSPEQDRMPLLEANRAYQEAHIARFHTPGHKGGAGAPAPLREMLGPALLYDACDEVQAPELGQDWDEAMDQAEELAAQFYRTNHTFFLVNGTTSGIQAMLLAAAGPGEEVILPRDAHWSAVSALILSGAHPVLLPTPYDWELGVPGIPEPEAYAQALQEHPNAKAVFLINPNYYGVAGRVYDIARIAHEAGIPLLVDEAHGPHLRFHPDLPPSALDAEADGVAQSMHKLLGAMTQASLLHVQGGRLPWSRVAAALRLVTSTSPNPLLCISLDAARWQMARYGRGLVARTLELARQVRVQLASIPGLKLWGREAMRRPGYHDLDLTKVIVDVSELGITGFEAERRLREYGVQVELSDLTHVLALITIGDTAESIARLVGAFQRLAAEAPARVSGPFHTLPLDAKGPARASGSPLALLRPDARFLPVPEAVMSPRDAFFAPSEWLGWDRAVGRVAAEWIAPYPPGIPVITPGERVTPEVAQAVHIWVKAGAHLRTFSPGSDGRQGIRVVADESL
ncbi:MAG: aminotransferase class V-fold PLP-dependent enzyme [Limnochordaceae bacterium]|nr:aminotransferase class V-fold PLP-dependent enzyme [Limnochordaceae bacterium]